MRFRPYGLKSVREPVKKKKNVENSTLGLTPPPYAPKCGKFSKKKKLKKDLKTLKI